MYRSKSMPMKKKPANKMTGKPTKSKSTTSKPTTSKLSDAMKKKLKEHSNHHTPKHMAMMRKDIKSGMSFTKAHNKAKKMVGK